MSLKDTLEQAKKQYDSWPQWMKDLAWWDDKPMWHPFKYDEHRSSKCATCGVLYPLHHENHIK